MINHTDNMVQAIAKLTDKNDEAARIIQQILLQFKGWAVNALLVLDSANLKGGELVKLYKEAGSIDALIFYARKREKECRNAQSSDSAKLVSASSKE